MKDKIKVIRYAQPGAMVYQNDKIIEKEDYPKELELLTKELFESSIIAFKIEQTRA